MTKSKKGIIYDDDKWYANQNKRRKIFPGDFYEDCRYHPMVCLENDAGSLTGISLIDGSMQCCDEWACAKAITLEEAVKHKLLGPFGKTSKYYKDWEDKQKWWETENTKSLIKFWYKGWIKSNDKHSKQARSSKGRVRRSAKRIRQPI